MIAGVQPLLAAYRRGGLRPVEVIGDLIRRRRDSPPAVWISQVDDQQLLEQAHALESRDAAALPLYGIPFAIKDNIDLEGLPTTAACPDFAYQPASSATVVQRLLAAGAIAVGKTNLDQFATGLVGTRSPWGACRNPFDPAYISGGSSSGSAVAVATGMVAFALGTDTAGSGRVPAAFNNLIGYKPTRGLISTSGVVPACRTLDTVSLFALTADDAALVAGIAWGHDRQDPFSRKARPSPRRGWSLQQGPRIAVPAAAQREFFGNECYERLFAATLDRLAATGCLLREVDISPLLEAARLLYEGPWLAERLEATSQLLSTRPAALLPVLRDILSVAGRHGAADAFSAQRQLQFLAQASGGIWEVADVLLLPTAGTHYRIAEVEAEPLLLNARLGHYTNSVNLLDLAAVAVPAGFTQAGLPFGVSLLAPAFEDEDLLAFASRLHATSGLSLGALGVAGPSPSQALPAITGMVDVAVCGAHLSGLPLNPQLTSRGARLVKATRTTPEYRLYALPGGPPYRPGLLRVDSAGAAIEIEIWRMPVERFGDFVAAIPAPLGIGRIRTEEGGEVSGFLCETVATQSATDITACGSWRSYLAGL